MTGFATATASLSGTAVTCELRSVNGKGLDVRLRLPPGFERLEIPVRKLFAEKLARGNIQCSVSLEQDDSASPVRIDDGAFRSIAEQAQKLAIECGLEPPTTDGILALRGIVVQNEDTMPSGSPGQGDTDQLIRDVVGQCIDRLVDMRKGEGAALTEMLRTHLDQLETLRELALSDPGAQPHSIQARLRELLSALFENTGQQKLDEDRIHAEAALLATKADVREETDRLAAHISAARDLIASGEAVGRKLDFLAQEFNREVNTLCSKSASVSLTAIGLDMKSVVDQFREQVQNLQ